MKGMESTFAIVAEPKRRAILSLLLESSRSVGELERALKLSQPSVSNTCACCARLGSWSRASKRSAGSITCGRSR